MNPEQMCEGYCNIDKAYDVVVFTSWLMELRDRTQISITFL